MFMMMSTTATPVNLDEDEMRRFITGDNYNCPYFRNDDEYELARKQ